MMANNDDTMTINKIISSSLYYTTNWIIVVGEVIISTALRHLHCVYLAGCVTIITHLFPLVPCINWRPTNPQFVYYITMWSIWMYITNEFTRCRILLYMLVSCNVCQVLFVIFFLKRRINSKTFLQSSVKTTNYFK